MKLNDSIAMQNLKAEHEARIAAWGHGGHVGMKKFGHGHHGVHKLTSPSHHGHPSGMGRTFPNTSYKNMGASKK